MAKKQTITIVRRYEADTSQWTKALSNIDRSAAQTAKSMKSMEDRAERTRQSLKNFGATLAGAISVAGITGAARRFSEFAKSVEDASKRTGIIGNTIEALGREAGKFGGSLDQTVDTLDEFTLRLAEAAREGGPVADMLQQIGLNAADLAGDPTRALETIRQKLVAINDPGMRAVIADTLFGEDGGKVLVQQLSSLGQSVDDFTSRMEGFNQIYGAETRQELQQYTSTMNELTQTLDVLGARVLGPVVEGFNRILRDLLAISRLDFSNLSGDSWKAIAGGIGGAAIGSLAGPWGTAGGAALGFSAGAAFMETELEKLEQSIAEYEKKLAGLSRKLATIRPEIGLADTFQREFDEYREKLIEAKNEMMRLTASTTAVDSAADWADAQSRATQKATDGWTAYVATTKQVLGLSNDAAGRLNQLGDAFENASKKFSVPKELLISIANAESAFQQIYGPLTKSGERAFGVMQIMPDTMKDIARDTGITVERMMTDINANVEAGAYYFKKLVTQMGGDVEKALAGYNWGPNRDVLKQPGNLDTGKLPAETQKYLQDVTGGYEKLSAAMGDFGPMAEQYRTNMEQLNEQERERAQRLKEQESAEKTRIENFKQMSQSVDYLAASYDYLYSLELQRKEVVEQLDKAEAAGVPIAERRLAIMKDVDLQLQRMRDSYVATTASVEGLGLQMKSAAFAGFNSWIDSAVQGTFKFKDAMADLLKQIVALTVKMAIFKAVSSAFGGTDFSGLFGLQANAMGNAFPGGVSLPQGIYNDPTIFKFAKGGSIGLLGEAGSEAILPLSRMSNGDLGVKSEPAKMIVNVNNNARGVEVSSRQVDAQTVELTVREIEARLQRGGNSTSRVFDSRYRR